MAGGTVYTSNQVIPVGQQTGLVPTSQSVLPPQTLRVAPVPQQPPQPPSAPRVRVAPPASRTIDIRA